MLRTLLLIALVLFAAACEDEDCNPPIEAFCGEHDGCEGTTTLKEALATTLARESNLSHAPEAKIVRCGDRVRAYLGDGYNGVVYVYDRDSGELVGATPYRDADNGDDECPGLNHWGEPLDGFTCDGGCVILNTRDPSFTNGYPACDVDLEIVKPFVESCEQRVGADAGVCLECACAECYPTIAAEAEAPDGGAFPTSVEEYWLSEECAEPCADLLPRRR